MKKKIFQAFWNILKFLMSLFGKKNKNIMLSWIMENSNVYIEKIIDNVQIKFIADSTCSLSRLENFLNYEPETIKWLNEIEHNDQLLEIGENIGYYTMYAAGTRKCKILAIESYPPNYLLFIKNVFNNFQDFIQAFCIGAGNKTEISNFNIFS